MLASVVTLFVCLVVFQEPLTLEYGGLAALAVVVGSRCISPPNLRNTLAIGGTAPLGLARRLVEWGTVVSILLLIGFAFKISDWYSRTVLLTWFLVTPVALVCAQRLQIRAGTWMNDHGMLSTRYVIVGVNKVGIELARRLPPRSCAGFFDFRATIRAADCADNLNYVGHCHELGRFVRDEGVGTVYIALPISNSDRIKRMLDDLRDSTATVYFVPDVFAFDLIQARVVDLNGMPGLAVCDTPHRGADAFLKRVLDVVLSAAAMVLLLPLFFVVAIAIKTGSTGPVLFRQRRYGLAGEAISVYKFRSMMVCEDSGDIRQASRQDARITPVGRFLRRTSIDELPQLINVLQGTMSLVGPRPHAVAHNELYRRKISGYMIRHKVLPGITGWAQVNGLRGETDTIEKMEARVRYDLEYLTSWSLLLDIRILVKTVLVVLRDKNAY